MSRDGHKVGRRPRRLLSREERALWTMVTREIAPLRPDASAGDDDGNRDKQVEKTDTPSAVSAPAAVVAKGEAHPGPAPLDRRFKQRLARGRVEIDGRIDLHGLTQAQAHHALAGFLRTASTQGAHVVLVITGKGAAAGDSERGVLRRQVPHWLKSNELRGFVVGFAPAHIAHGGDGALYVRIRRSRLRP
jgi:DNA-nicking Smr family endonuclease